MDKISKNDFRLNRETFTAGRVYLEETYEHPVEKDFVLPDYYPDIFRVLKCFVNPVVTSRGINANKLSFEGTAVIRVLYISENSSAVNCIEAKVPFSKSVEFQGECLNPSVQITSACEYINCRVVNQRRLDVRGAVTTSVKIVGEETANVVTDAFGEGIQLKKTLCSLPAKRITVAKRVTLIEDLELAESKPSLGTVIRSSCKILETSEKIIAGKLVTKGEAEITVIYTCADKEGSQGAENMKFTVPFSQIIDMEGIDEGFSADVEISAEGCEIMPKGESGHNAECELTLLVNCTAIKYIQQEIVVDAYSTCWDCNTVKSRKSISQKGETLKKECSLSFESKCCEGNVKQIFDCYGEIKNIFCELNKDKKAFMISGNVLFGILGKDENDTPFFSENESTFEEEISLPEGTECDEIFFEPRAKVTECSYRIAGENSVEIKFDYTLSGMMKKSAEREIIENIILDKDSPKKQESGYALKLCRINGKEDIWEIAKKYSTSVKAILEENEIEDDNQAAEGMLLIPLMK